MLPHIFLKTLYHEMNPDKIEGVREYENDRKSSTFHEIALEVPGYPEIKTLTAELAYLVYNATQYSVHINGNLQKQEALDDPAVNAAIACFFKTYKAEYLKADLPEDLSGRNILDCLDPDKIPDYRPTFAFPGLVLLEDIRNGTAKAPDFSKPAFPGLRMLTKEPAQEERPAYVSADQEYIKIDSAEDCANTIEELKKKFSMEGLEDLQMPKK